MDDRFRLAAGERFVPDYATRRDLDFFSQKRRKEVNCNDSAKVWLVQLL